MAAEVRRITWGGTSYSARSAGTALEIWSCQLHAFCAVGALALDPWLDAVADLVSTFHTDPHTGIDETESLDYVKASPIDLTTGHETADPVPQWTPLTATRGGSTETLLPFSSSVRVSIDDATRSRRAKGGFYIPRLSIAIQQTGRISTAAADLIVGSAGALLLGINTLAETQVGVYSRVGHSFTPSTRIRVGDVPDDISRRRNAMRETYSQYNL